MYHLWLNQSDELSLGWSQRLFRVAKQSRIYQDIVEQIQEAIISGDLKAGDRLPAERELKETFQTSRGTVREALRVLEQKGLIEIKLGTGGGAVVKAITSDLVADSLDILIRSQQIPIRYLAEFRERVEEDVVKLATERMTPDHRSMLKTLLDDARRHAGRGDDGVSDFLTTDKKIHLAFAHIAGNPLYVSILKTIHENIQRYYDTFLKMKEPEMVENLKDLEKVVAAMEKGDAKQAGSFSRMHVARFSQYMEQREQRKRV